MIYDGQGINTQDGSFLTTDVTVSNISGKYDVYYDADSGCGEKYNTSSPSVQEQLTHAWDGLSYGGINIAPWDFTRKKYHVLNGHGIAYYYQQSNYAIRFIVEINSSTNTSRVYDYGQGFIEKNFTQEDFALKECQ